MIFFRLLTIIGVCFCYEYEFDSEILTLKPWGVNQCSVSKNQTCAEKTNSCVLNCTSLEYCEIRAAVLLPQNSSYIANLNEVKA